jgi:hypothetical protein
MHVRGVAFLARQELLRQEVGAERWSAYLTGMRPRLQFLASPVLPVTRIPIDEFLALNEDIVRTFYQGDQSVWWRFGEQSGEWALQKQLKGLFEAGEARKFLQFTPKIWASYYDGGQLTAEAGDGTVDVRIFDLPVQHLYFEASVIGFAKGGLKVLGFPDASPQRLKGFTQGDDEVLYRYPAPS